MSNYPQNDDEYKMLPELCMELHMHHTGACEDLTDERYLARVEYLHERVEAWNMQGNGWCWYGFDAAVFALIIATLAESNKYIKTMPRIIAAAPPEP